MSSNCDEVLHVLTDDWQTTAEIARKVGRHPSLVYRNLMSLGRFGLLEKTKKYPWGEMSKFVYAWRRRQQ